MHLFTADPRPSVTRARDFNDVIASLDQAGFGSASGAIVNTTTAMQQSTVWACVRIISEIIAQLPIEVQRLQGAQWITAESHDALGILAEPNAYQTQHDLISHLVSWAELVGNGYLFKVLGRDNSILQLLPIEGAGVQVEQLQDWSLRYSLSANDGRLNGEYTSERVFHYRNFALKGFVGMSTIGAHRDDIGMALSLKETGAKRFKHGLTAGAWIKLQNTDPDHVEKLKNRLKEYESAENAGKTLILGGNAELHDRTIMTAVDAQYVETLRFSKQEIAAIFGVPLFLLNDTEKSTTWGTGLEQLSRSFVRFSLRPRLNRLAETLKRELIPRSKRATTRFIFDTDAFTLGEFKERMEGYRSAIESGVLNPDECREIEGRNPREGGGQYRQPVNIAIEGQANEAQAPAVPV